MERRLREESVRRLTCPVGVSGAAIFHEPTGVLPFCRPRSPQGGRRGRTRDGETEMIQLDEAERRILRELQRDGSQTVAQLAAKVGLSASPCWRRVDRLEREGVIRGRVALVDRRKVGLNAHIFAQVRLNAHGRANLDEFATAIQAFPEVLDAYVLMGKTDFMLRIVARDIDAYERFFFDKLSRLPGIQEITSTVALSEIKSTSELPI
jgi:Lrp/AsnC family transcriptional regulator